MARRCCAKASPNLSSSFSTLPRLLCTSAKSGLIVRHNGNTADGTDPNDGSELEVHKGPRGSIVEFMLQTTDDVQSGTYWFERYGSTMTGLTHKDGSTALTCYYIDHNIKLTGLNTGVSIDIPIRLVKYKSG